jgi:hypothetical protein
MPAGWAGTQILDRQQLCLPKYTTMQNDQKQFEVLQLTLRTTMPGNIPAVVAHLLLKLIKFAMNRDISTN